MSTVTRRSRGRSALAIGALVGALSGRLAAAQDVPVVSVPLPPIDLRLVEEGRRLPIDLPTATRLALAGNLDILAARARVREASGEKNRAVAAFLPKGTISFTAGDIDGRIQGSFGDLENRTFGTINPAGRLTLTVDPGLALFDSLARYRALDATTEREAVVIQDTILAVAEQYFDLERAQARIVIAEQAVAASKELVRVSENREQLGVGLEVDVARAQAQLAEDEGVLARRQEEFRIASVRLAVTTKLDPVITLFPFAPVLAPRRLVAPAVLSELLARAASRRPEVREVADRATAAGHEVTASWWKAVGPKLGGVVEESAIGRSIGDLDDRRIVGGVIGWEVSPGAIGAIQAARARRDAADIEVDRAGDAVRAEVVRAYESVLVARDQIEVGVRGVDAADATQRLSQSRFESGVGLALEVLEAQRALVAARTALVAAIQDYNTAQVRLLRAIGELSETSLVAAR